MSYKNVSEHYIVKNTMYFSTSVFKNLFLALVNKMMLCSEDTLTYSKTQDFAEKFAMYSIALKYEMQYIDINTDIEAYTERVERQIYEHINIKI